MSIKDERPKVTVHRSPAERIAARKARAQLEPKPQRPSLRSVAMEMRLPLEVAGGVLSYLFAHRLPAGEGQPVLIYPGFLAGDGSTLLLRRVLEKLGYPTYGWDQGANLGPRHGVLSGCRDRLMAIADRHGQKVSLIGWSLGGVYAREMAKMLDDHVRQVVTMGSPFAGSPKATNAYRLFRLLSGHSVHDDPRLLERLREVPPVPTSSIYSRHDGVVHWHCSLQHPTPWSENIEVAASHLGMGFNPIALYVLADRLAQRERQWRPFARGGFRRLFFRDPPVLAPG